MKQIYALNVCRSARFWLHLMLVVWCGTAAAKSPVRDSAVLRLPVQTDRVAAGDLVITASQIRAVDPVDLWKAISFYDPSISNSWEQEHGSDPVYGAGDMTVRGSKRWARDEAVKPSRPVYIIDGLWSTPGSFSIRTSTTSGRSLSAKTPGFAGPIRYPGR